MPVFLIHIFVHFFSPLNRSMLERACQAEGVPNLVPTRVGGTRWMDHILRAITNLEQITPAMLTHFEQV